MSRSVHETFRRVFKDKTKAEVDEMTDPISPDPEVEELLKKKSYKKSELTKRKRSK